MKNSKAVRLIVALLGGFMLQAAWTTRARAAAPCDPWVAKMVSVQGSVEVRRAGQAQWMPARLNDLYCGGDQIQVGERSRADMALVNHPVIRLDQNTTISLGGIREQRVSWLDLLRGVLYFFSRTPRNLEVRTAFVNAGVEGTEGLIHVDASRALITIFEGMVLAANPSGSLTLSGGQSAITEPGKPPVLTTLIRPRDAVQWAIYYPPTVHFRAADFRAGPGWEGAARNSLEAYGKGDLRKAFEAIGGVPDTVGDSRFFVYRASLLLAVGRFDEAMKDIERALRLTPSYSEALALQSVAAVAQNERQRALPLAQQAATADPNSAAALIALSYAQQASFDLDGALATLQRAVQSNPENALAWARLAELWLSFGELQEALDAAQKAAALDPNLSRTQTVSGFAYLTQADTEGAKQAFEKAIQLDQADPLARLGLGLARIREGNLEEGRREIEIAVSLDPDNALIRSYLGKAYFEEKRDKQAGDQYEMSKQLDPRDPTPYFYDAIRKQTTNRPVEALQDMQRAIELNDNRAVYRSRLLLDSDLAARSAALSRIYSDLGFQQLALVEGWKSVNTDPTNFSAHRFLADSYAVLPRHEIARVSELLQSQLLQPLNMNPIQPHLAESNLLLISAGGPGALSFNEFNPLFNRNGIHFQSTGVAGENSTYGGEGVLSGVYNQAAFSLGGFHFQTNGFRKNAFQDDTVGTAFLQFELSPQTSIQGEIRRRELKYGDLQQRFFPADRIPGLTNEADRWMIRAGGRHLLSPNSVILGSVLFQDDDGLTEISVPGFLQKFINPSRAVGSEFQHLYRGAYFNVTSGLGYFDIDGKLKSLTRPPFFPDTSTGQDLRHYNGYVYASTNPVSSVNVTIGASFDHLKGDDAAAPEGSTSQANPKFGVTWTPLPGTVLRAAILRTLKRTLITNQTLEPTHVAGFNQFFDDPNQAESWRYGAAVDQKLSNSLFAGLEYSRRDLSVPILNTLVFPAKVKETDTREYLGRGYLFWTPQPWLAVRGEYLFERFVNDPERGDNRLTSHRIPLGMNLAFASGFNIGFTSTYLHQVGSVTRPSGARASLREDFWVIDAALRYRFPGRHGFISIGATNLFDRKFKFFDTDINNPTIQPKRTIFIKLTYSLP